jgi:hypothetical protein
MDASRLVAWLGSALGNATLFGAILAGWPGLPPWNFTYSEPSFDIVQLGFRPFVDPILPANLFRQPGVNCPQPLRAGPVVLDHAPLPPAFGPFAFRDPVFACVRVDRIGAISGVALIGVEDAKTAAALTRTIRNDWRFAPSSADRVDAGWVRVRLTATAYSSSVDYFYPL